MDQRRVGANFVQLSMYWRQVIAANLKIIALEPTLSFTLYNRARFFQKNDTQFSKSEYLYNKMATEQKRIEYILPQKVAFQF